MWEVGERSHEPVAQVGVKDEPARFHVVAYDFGIKQNILRKLRGEGCQVTVVPAQTLAEDVLALKPDGVFLSNGPGAVSYTHLDVYKRQSLNGSRLLDRDSAVARVVAGESVCSHAATLITGAIEREFERERRPSSLVLEGLGLELIGQLLRPEPRIESLNIPDLSLIHI